MHKIIVFIAKTFIIHSKHKLALHSGHTLDNRMTYQILFSINKFFLTYCDQYFHSTLKHTIFRTQVSVYFKQRILLFLIFALSSTWSVFLVMLLGKCCRHTRDKKGKSLENVSAHIRDMVWTCYEHVTDMLESCKGFVMEILGTRHQKRCPLRWLKRWSARWPALTKNVGIWQNGL